MSPLPELVALNSTAIDGDSTVLGRDPLSVLIRSKLATAATPAAQLSSSETLLQISMFIAAGFETTSSALSWALFALSGAPGAQMKLRDAMRAVPAPPQGGERDDAGGGGGKSNGVPGLYAGILTFLNGSPLSGNRACIGYRFALLEMKVFLYILIRDLAVGIDPGLVAEKKINVVTRPFVASEPGLGNQLPLRISRVNA
ncbi:hypothetical protein FIBSPDRAFT_877880 [Athelia psychrophila]|uniref:Cytochrome P450 n=1 Tax=Athelia psychrophila TaxID=1759441 RepID=A0A167VKY5_9AGAM|nr:hypothetical protein FIBSPDRAFT_877880 [Fibularhizoctonia sp. CBS 109695]